MLHLYEYYDPPLWLFIDVLIGIYNGNVFVKDLIKFFAMLYDLATLGSVRGITAQSVQPQE